MRLTIKVYADENVIFESVFENPGKEASVDIKTQENQASINEVKGPEVTEAIIEEIAPSTNEIKEPNSPIVVAEEQTKAEEPNNPEVVAEEQTKAEEPKAAIVVVEEQTKTEEPKAPVAVSSNVIHAQENFDFDKAVSQPGIVIIYFSARKRFAFANYQQILEDIANESGGRVKIYILMMDYHYKLAKSLGINRPPAICMYKDGENVSSKAGFYKKEDIKKWINSPGANIAPTKAPKATKEEQNKPAPAQKPTKEEQRKPASPVASNDTKNNITKKSPETREIKSEPETIADTIIEIKSEPETIAEKVILIITEKLGLEEGEAQLNSKLVNDLGADSLDFAELILEIEGDFSISIPEKIYEEARDISVKGLVELVESLTK